MTSQSEQVSDDFLDSHNVCNTLRDAVFLLLRNRPENPIEYFSEYLNFVIHGSSPITNALRLIKMSKPNRKGFFEHLTSAYLTLHNSYELGLSIVQLRELVRLLAADYPPRLVNHLLASVDLYENQICSFPIFAATVRSCLAHGEFYENISTMFHTLDTRGTGRILKKTALKIIDEISAQKKAVEKQVPSAASLQDNLDTGGDENVGIESQEEISVDYAEFSRMCFEAAGITMRSTPAKSQGESVENRLVRPPEEKRVSSLDGDFSTALPSTGKIHLTNLTTAAIRKMGKRPLPRMRSKPKGLRSSVDDLSDHSVSSDAAIASTQVASLAASRQRIVPTGVGTLSRRRPATAGGRIGQARRRYV